MKRLSRLLERGLQYRGTAIGVFLLSLLVTIFAWVREKELWKKYHILRFQEEISKENSFLLLLMGGRFEELRTAAAPLHRTDKVTPEEWQEYIRTIEWQTRFPGMLEIGYAEPVTQTNSSQKIVVDFVSSDISQPLHPVGSDLLAEPKLRETVAKVRDAGYGMAFPELYLKMAGEKKPRQIVVSFLPLSFRAMRPGTPEENRKNFRAMLFFVLDQREYFKFVQSKIKNDSLDLQLLGPNEQGTAKPPNQRVISYGGVSGTWRFLCTLKPQGSPQASQPPWGVLAVGSFASAVIFLVFWSQARLRRNVEQTNATLRARDAEIEALNHDLEQRIAERTAQLRTVNARLSAEIIERETAQAHLARFKSVAEATSDLVAMASLDGQVMYLNKAGRQMMGIREEEDYTRLKVPEFYPDRVNKMFEEIAFPAAMRDGAWSGEVALLRRDGTELPVSMVGLILRSADGKPEYMACIIRDITERRRSEEQLRRALDQEKELSQLKSNFISMVSHEIRTPLALILSSSEVLNRYFDRLPLEKRQRHLDTIGSSVERMSELLEDVLLLSRAEAGKIEFKPERFDLASFCRQLADELYSATSGRNPIELNLTEFSSPACGDEALLRHIFSNLISNAIKYSPPGSSVVLSVCREGDRGIFCVRDHGRGIPEADRKHLFTPFYRGKNVATIQGTGLGLVIVRHCVERHGGQIDLQSTENVGTSMTVTLPLFIDCTPTTTTTSEETRQ